MVKRKRYDDKFRANAVVMLQAAGYPEQKGALTRVAEHLKTPRMNLSRWFKETQNPPPPELVTEKREDLAALFETAARKYLKHAINDDVVGDTSGGSAMTAAAIATDKMRLLQGLPTEIVGIVTPLLGALQEAGLDPAQVFRDMIDELGKARLENAGAPNTGAGEGARAGE